MLRRVSSDAGRTLVLNPLPAAARLFALPVLAAAATLLLGRAGGAHHLLDLASHFTPYCVAALAVGVPLLFAGRYRITALLALPALVWGIALLATSEIAGGARADADATLGLVTLNLWSGNRDFGRALNDLAGRDADVVVVMEMDRSWHDALRRGLPDHRYYAGEIHGGNFGIGVFSRLPLYDSGIVDLGARVPSVVATLRPPGGGALTLVATHPPPPLGARLFDARNRHLLGLARLLQARPGPAVVAGDLNVTPWSVWFRRLLRGAALRDTRVGFGFHATWPARLAPLGIPVDHVLVRGVGVTARDVGPNVGSDHRAVQAALRVPKTSGPVRRRRLSTASPSSTAVTSANAGRVSPAEAIDTLLDEAGK